MAARVPLSLRVLAPLLGIASASPSDAERVLVLDTAVSKSYVNASVRFVVNEEAGRTWVEAVIDNGGEGEVWDYKTLRAKPEGLSYDAGTGEIAYADARSRVVCAKATRSRLLLIKWTSIKTTAACRLLSRFESVVHDDGFDLERKTHLVVELSIVR